MNWYKPSRSNVVIINGVTYEIGDRVAIKTFENQCYCGKVTVIKENELCLADRMDTKICLHRNKIKNVAYIPF